MSLIAAPDLPKPCTQSSTDHPRRAASDEPLSLVKVLGDLGAWLEETERHRKTVGRVPTGR